MMLIYIVKTFFFFFFTLNNSVLFQHTSILTGEVHPLLCIPIKSSKEAVRYSSKLKLLTGTYVLQSNRSVFNQNAVDPVSRLCNIEEETTEHVLLRCPELSLRSNVIMNIMNTELTRLDFPNLSELTSADKVKLMLDLTYLIVWHNLTYKSLLKLRELEFNCKTSTFPA